MFEVPVVGRPTLMRCHHQSSSSSKSVSKFVGQKSVWPRLVSTVQSRMCGISNSSVLSALFGPVVTSCVHTLSTWVPTI